MKEEKYPIDGYNEDEQIKGIKIVFGTDQTTAFIGTAIAKTTSYKYFNTNVDSDVFVKIESDSEIIKQNIKDALGDLFDILVIPNSFGLHSVLYCSY